MLRFLVLALIVAVIGSIMIPELAWQLLLPGWAILALIVLFLNISRKALK